MSSRRRARARGSLAGRERGVRGGAKRAVHGPARRRSARPASPASSRWQGWDRGVMTEPWPCHHCERERRPSATPTAVVAVKFHPRRFGHRTGELARQITWLRERSPNPRRRRACECRKAEGQMVDLAYHDAALLFLASKAPHALNITFCFSGHFTLKKRVTSCTFNEKRKVTIYYIRHQSAFSERNRSAVDPPQRGEGHTRSLFWLAR